MEKTQQTQKEAHYISRVLRLKGKIQLAYDELYKLRQDLKPYSVNPPLEDSSEKDSPGETELDEELNYLEYSIIGLADEIERVKENFRG